MYDGGSTPTIVTGVLFSRTVLPTIDAIAAEAPLPERVADDRHRLGAGLSSDSSMVRPAIAGHAAAP